MSSAVFADRLAALVDERHSQICLGLDPDPADLRSAGKEAGAGLPDGASAAQRAGAAIAAHCRELIELAGPACVAVKPQLACFERLGAPGWAALAETAAVAHEAGLLVLADGKRGDVPVTVAAYAQALLGSTPTPWGEVAGLGADALTANPLLGGEALDPLVDAAEAAGAGVFSLVRTSNPGAAEIQDLATGDGVAVHERLAAIVAERAARLAGPESGLSGMGAVVGGTQPQLFGRLRELMPHSVFLIPGIGAQGGRPGDLGAALAAGRPASVMVAAARSIAGAEDPAAAAAELRDSVWQLS